ncbi:hypothetical protein [Cytobacillus sp. IB215665]|nr:hypothetical protein [Cytobacillus sp. IB215665]MDX8366067.1 hypothetical protein [Cytobacillus sp. IB215665]
MVLTTKGANIDIIKKYIEEGE